MAVCILLVLPILHNLWCVDLICVGLCGVHTVRLTHAVSLTCAGYRGSQGSHMYNFCLQRVLHA